MNNFLVYCLTILGYNELLHLATSLQIHDFFCLIVIPSLPTKDAVTSPICFVPFIVICFNHQKSLPIQT